MGHSVPSIRAWVTMSHWVVTLVAVWVGDFYSETGCKTCNRWLDQLSCRSQTANGATEGQMRIVMLSIWVVLLGGRCSAIGQASNDQSATPATQESPQKPPCKPPKVVFNPPAKPPDSWVGKGEQSGTSRLELIVDKKGRVKNPSVVQSGGKDVDREAMEAVRQWRFIPGSCGTEPIETKIQVQVDIHLQ